MVFLRDIESNHSFKVGLGRRVLSKTEQDHSQIPAAQCLKERVVDTLSHPESLFSELTCPLMLAPHIVMHCECAQHPAQLRRLSRLEAQFAGSDVGISHL